MGYKRFVYPGAETEIEWHIKTYGSEFAKELHAWFDKIVKYAPDKPSELVVVPLSKVLEDVVERWEYVLGELKKASTLELVRAALVLLKERKPPYELVAVEEKIFTQDHFWVEVTALIRIDRAGLRIEIVKLQ